MTGLFHLTKCFHGSCCNICQKFLLLEGQLFRCKHITHFVDLPIHWWTFVLFYFLLLWLSHYEHRCALFLFNWIGCFFGAENQWCHSLSHSPAMGSSFWKNLAMELPDTHMHTHITETWHVVTLEFIVPDSESWANAFHHGPTFFWSKKKRMSPRHPMLPKLLGRRENLCLK